MAEEINQDSLKEFSVDFGPELGTKLFADIQSFRQALQSINQGWTWLNGAANSSGNSSKQHIEAKLSPILTSYIQNAETYQQQNRFNDSFNSLNQAKSHTLALFKEFPWISPDHSLHSFILDLRDQNNHAEAVAIVHHLLGLTGQLNISLLSQIKGLIKLDFFQRGIKSRVKFEHSNLERLASEYATKSVDIEKEISLKNKQFSDFLESCKRNVAEQILAQDEASKSKHQEWEDALSQTKTDLKNLTDTYDNQMSLRKPVEYWERKRRKHRTMSIASFVLLSFGVGVGLFTLYWLFKSSLAVQLDIKVAESFAQGIALNVKSGSTFHIILMVLMATLYFWIVRLVVRIFLSNLHLENDASERVTMVTTYLALLRDGALDKTNTMPTVLAALFRPTGDGIVKDEGLPPTAMEWMTKLGGR